MIVCLYRFAIYIYDPVLCIILIMLFFSVKSSAKHKLLFLSIRILCKLMSFVLNICIYIIKIVYMVDISVTDFQIDKTVDIKVINYMNRAWLLARCPQFTTLCGRVTDYIPFYFSSGTNIGESAKGVWYPFVGFCYDDQREDPLGSVNNNMPYMMKPEDVLF